MPALPINPGLLLSARSGGEFITYALRDAGFAGRPLFILLSLPALLERGAVAPSEEGRKECWSLIGVGLGFEVSAFGMASLA